jgi:DNA-binding FadR family transcriptional regulator
MKPSRTGAGAELCAGLTTATARTILGVDTDPRGLAPQMAQRIARAVHLGLIPDGGRLPPEAQLSEQLGVATATLREALAILRAEGLVVTRRGRAGGTFARAPREDGHDTLLRRLAGVTMLDLRELGDHRRAISGTSAALAAERALPADMSQLRRRLERLASAPTAADYHRCETLFSIELTLAAQSPRLTREELRLRSELGDLCWARTTDAERDAATASRHGLVRTIGRGDRDGARAIAEAQVAEETRRLLELRLELYGTASAQQARATIGDAG